MGMAPPGKRLRLFRRLSVGVRPGALPPPPAQHGRVCIARWLAARRGLPGREVKEWPGAAAGPWGKRESLVLYRPQSGRRHARQALPTQQLLLFEWISTA